MNRFKEKMSLLTTKELLNIITYLREDYQDEAILVAEEILQEREVNQAEIEKITQELKSEKIEESKPSPLENKLNEVSELFNPQEKNPTHEKWIKYLTIVIAISLLGTIWRDLKIVYYSLFVFEYPDFYAILNLIPIIYLPFCIINLWQFKSIGWKLIVIYFSFSFAALIFQLALWGLMFSNSPDDSTSSFIDNTFQSIITPGQSPQYLIVQLIIMTIVLRFLNKIEVLKLFHITSKQQKRCIFIPIGLSALLFTPIIILTLLLG